MRALSPVLMVLAVLTPCLGHAQSTPKPEILIVGTYHMANPGRDVHNMEVDDVLSQTRQREIAELLKVLRSFRPTKIAVEAPVGSRLISEQYAAYLAGDHTLSRNESEQIGFRLARELGHPAIHSVDVSGEFPYYRVRNYAIANGMQEEFDSLSAATAGRVARQEEFLRSHTILETLVAMNSDSAVAEDVAAYYAFVPFGEPYEYAGPDLVARWFERNIRIYRNIRALVTAPDDRILVICGAGHLGWLQQNVRSDGTVRLRTLSDIIRR